MTSFRKASGRTFEVPLFDPVVAQHFALSSSYTDTIIKELNDGLYAPLFENKKGLTFLDIGANIGLVSIYASDSCKRIVSVEPAPTTFTVLKSMTLGIPHIEPIQFALSPVDGPCQFYVNPENSTASSTVNTFGTMWNVRGLTLMSILRANQLEHVDICKIDAEGSEGESLSFEQLEEAAPIVDCYMVETHNCPSTTYQYKLGKLTEHFTKLGYSTQVKGMTIISKR